MPMGIDVKMVYTKEEHLNYVIKNKNIKGTYIEKNQRTT